MWLLVLTRCNELQLHLVVCPQFMCSNLPQNTHAPPNAGRHPSKAFASCIRLRQGRGTPIGATLRVSIGPTRTERNGNENAIEPTRPTLDNEREVPDESLKRPTKLKRPVDRIDFRGLFGCSRTPGETGCNLETHFMVQMKRCRPITADPGAAGLSN